MKKNRLDYSQIIFAIIFFNLIIAIFLIIIFFVFSINVIDLMINIIKERNFSNKQKNNIIIGKTSELN
jgi:hypothetical protein